MSLLEFVTSEQFLKILIVMRLFYILILLPVLIYGLKFKFKCKETKLSTCYMKYSTMDSIPQHGIIGGTEDEVDLNYPVVSPLSIKYNIPSNNRLLLTRFLLWLQPSWRKIPDNAILNVKLGGSLSIEPSTELFKLSYTDQMLKVDSLHDLISLLQWSAYDPGIRGMMIELHSLSCGYAKLIEVKRWLDLFRQSGKPIIGYAEIASEKELYLSTSFNEFYIPPEGSVDIRGFSTLPTFYRGLFNKIGIEPHIQRIGKYKSFGDILNCTNITQPHREVLSTVITSLSAHWASTIARRNNCSIEKIMLLWNETKLLSPTDYAQRGLVTGLRYRDQVEGRVQEALSAYSSSSTTSTSMYPPLGLIWQLITSMKWLFIPGALLYAVKEREAERLEQEDRLLLTGYSSSTSSSNLTVAEDLAAFPRRTSFPVEKQNISLHTTESERTQKTLISKDNSQQKEIIMQQRARTVLPRHQLPLVPGITYLRKLQRSAAALQGLPVREVTSGPRTAIINAVGMIGTGYSTESGLMGAAIGTETLTAQLAAAREDNNIQAVVLRIDSPGGSALASDILWREIRRVSRVKPIVASMVDIAASGGYYLAMACDEIVAEEQTLTGSIGVVSAKFSTEQLRQRLGLHTEAVSIGRYAEVQATHRGFTPEEAQYFEDSAIRAYRSFVEKAALSRGLSVAAVEEAAQGRVWTGQQALRCGLVDHTGGLDKALQVAQLLSQQTLLLNAIEYRPTSSWTVLKRTHSRDVEPICYRVQTLREPRTGLSAFTAVRSAAKMLARAVSSIHMFSNLAMAKAPLALCFDTIE